MLVNPMSYLMEMSRIVEIPCYILWKLGKLWHFTWKYLCRNEVIIEQYHSFHLHITYRKVKNLHISVDKLVGKVLLNLLHHTKSAGCVINMIIDASAVAYAHS